MPHCCPIHGGRLRRREIDAIADADARENWHFMIALRDHLAAHRTLEAAYAALVREGIRGSADLSRSAGPPHPAQRARSMRRCVCAARRRIVLPPAAPDGARRLAARRRRGADRWPTAPPVSPLAAMLGLPADPEIDVLSDDNAASYWERSDRFDLALDLTAGRRGLAALGTVIARWVKHLLDIDVIVEPLNELRDAALAMVCRPRCRRHEDRRRALERRGDRRGDARQESSGCSG